MMVTLTQVHSKRLREITEKLKSNGQHESAFTSVEILFYEAIAIARNYGDESTGNTLLQELKYLESNQYQSTQGIFPKSSRREQKIKSFITQLVRLLSRYFSRVLPEKILL